MTIQQYLTILNQRYKLGNATEHTFRGDLASLIETIIPHIVATNEPKRQSCGAPDYILTKKDIPVGFIEAKDLGDKDLDGLKKTGNKEQFDRYKASLTNIIFTDYLDFHLYRNGEFVTKISLGEIADHQIKPHQRFWIPHRANDQKSKKAGRDDGRKSKALVRCNRESAFQ